MIFTPCKPTPTKHILSVYDLMYSDQKGLCCYCEVLMFHKDRDYSAHVPAGSRRTPKRLATREHLKRKAEGGTNDPGNIRLACYDCNVGRGETDWMTYKSLKMKEIKPWHVHS